MEKMEFDTEGQVLFFIKLLIKQLKYKYFEKVYIFNPSNVKMGKRKFFIHRILFKISNCSSEKIRKQA